MTFDEWYDDVNWPAIEAAVKRGVIRFAWEAGVMEERERCAKYVESQPGYGEALAEEIREGK